MNTKKQNGFTLTEVMISVALVGAIIGLSMASFMALARGAVISKQWSLMHAELRMAADRMSRDLAGASNIMNLSTNFFGANTTLFGVNGISSNGTYTVYYVKVSNGDLWRVAASGNQKLAADVTGFSYKLYTDDGLTETAVPSEAFSADITLTGQKSVADEVFDDVFQTRIMFRNKLL